MEGLLHWDFNPGLAVAGQVRRRFGEMVHFSPSRDIKEFFLVVSFSSALFPLSEESVGVSLQCCIGGHPKGFKVSRINVRSFCFSVAGNKVGHLIHGLKDRIWPDFICHFHLFNGRFNDYKHFDNQWHADERLEPIATRIPMAIRSISPSLPRPLFKTQLRPKSCISFASSLWIPWIFTTKTTMKHHVPHHVPWARLTRQVLRSLWLNYMGPINDPLLKWITLSIQF